MRSIKHQQLFSPHCKRKEKIRIINSLSDRLIVKHWIGSMLCYYDFVERNVDIIAAYLEQ